MRDKMKPTLYNHSHENKITARRCMAAIDIRVKDFQMDRAGQPWVTLSDTEATDLALDILFTVDRETWMKAVGRNIK
jgi:hypothetical protein